MLVASDFDGTLAEIVPDPMAAAPLPEAIVVLNRLAGLPDVRVAIVSGRPLADLRVRCPIPSAWYVGGHGIEMAGPNLGSEGRDQKPGQNRSSGTGDPRSAPGGPGAYPELRPRLTAFADDLRRQLPRWPGAELEVKPYSLSVHFRRAPAWAEPVRQYISALTSGGGFRLLLGRQVVEILPENAPTKGLAVHRLRTQLGCDLAFYFGDDVTDEDVFRLDDDALVGVKVLHPEVKPADTAASYSLESPGAVVEALGAIERLFPSTANKTLGFSVVQP